MIRCSFCEQPLICQTCARPFQPKRGETHLALYQPDMAITCPECQTLLVCKACGFVYGEESDNQVEGT
jgi:hypothetical protein